jgi:hypothetical protein
MVVQTPDPPSEVVDAFVAIAHRIVWCTVATVDRRGRPRSRVLHPLWERGDEGLTGWITTRPTPLKRAHLERSPFVSCSYWDPAHDTAVAECRATWVHEESDRGRVWRLFEAAPAPLGHDPASIWPGGPGSPDAGVLRLEPWRLRALPAAALMAGEPGLSWRRPAGSPKGLAGARRAPGTPAG